MLAMVWFSLGLVAQDFAGQSPSAAAAAARVAMIVCIIVPHA